MRHTYIMRMSTSNLALAELGALLGDPARANILAALIDGRAFTATELAGIAGVAPQTTSGHLAKLTQANLLALEKQGRHRYYRLASPLVGSMLESVMALASVQLPARHSRPSRLDVAMRDARSCYDHVAGRLGVAVADTLLTRAHIVMGDDGGEVTAAGARFFGEFGVELKRGSRRPLCRPCLDWSERRWHLAGAVGAALYGRWLDLRWIERRKDTRALAITASGSRGFAEIFGVRLSEHPEF
jgi:DNA-binding transcriptional ArsR family regulator